MKNFLKSKTIWFNVFTGLLTLGEVLPAEWGALALAIGNLGLRFVTKDSLSIF